MLLVRTATTEDAGAIARVHAQARAAYYGAGGTRLPPESDAASQDRRRFWAGLVADDDATVRCAELDGAVVGFIAMEPTGSATLQLVGLYVLPECWATGVGSRLHAEFVEQLRRTPEMMGALDVWSGNRRAVAFWERRGWRFDGRSRPGLEGTTYEGMRLGSL
jgi:ribosomal protein S18 acetylase RimI-like enzyme